MRKAQLTVFFILGAVLILGGAIWWVMTQETVGEGEKTTQQISLQSEQRSMQLEQYFNHCVERESYQGLTLIGMHGGYRDIPASFNVSDMALWQFDSANTQPFLNTTRAELEEYLEIALPECMTQQAAQLQGFTLSRGMPQAQVDFADDDVSVRVLYPLTVTQGDYKAEYGEFTHTVKLPFRKIFEIASALNEHALLAEFKPEAPLEGSQGYGYALSFTRPSADMILFTVTDTQTVTPDTVPYRIQFLAKFGLTGLEKVTSLQDSSATIPALYTYEARSPDNMAILYLLSGTTINKDGEDVGEIAVDQDYLSSLVTSGLPGNLNGGSINYIISNPRYSFEPSGIVFNQPVPLIINYENSSDTSEGVGMLMCEDGFCFPIRSFDDPQNRRVTSYIQGFTDYTAVNCANQTMKTATITDEEHPSGLCYVSLALSVAMLGATIYLDGPLFSQLFSGNFAGAVDVAGSSLIPLYNSATAGMTLLPTIAASSATTVGLTYAGLSAVSLIGTAADMVKPGIFYENSPENCQNYIPTCAQSVSVGKQEDDGSGMCVPDGNGQVGAGQPSTVCAQVEKCNPLNRFLCMPCSVKCTVSFK